MRFFILFLGLCLFSFSSAAGSLQGDLLRAPSSFVKNLKRFVFLDITNAHYNIEYDLDSKKTRVVSTINFRTADKGYPVFDLLQPIDSARLDGKRVRVGGVSFPGEVSSAKYVRQEINPGEHILVLKSKIEDTIFESNSLKSAFWMSDLGDREFLERYLPANLDYDQVPMQFDVSIVGENAADHTLQVNCNSQDLPGQSWKVSCPSTYNSSSLFFHVYKTSRFQSSTNQFKSISGSNVEVTIYGTDPSSIVEETRVIFNELETDYGEWPYSHLLIYFLPSYSGGMEYAGATVTGRRALGHELHHSYFARSVFPRGGSAGWIDEALASWRDRGYNRVTELLSRDETRMASYSQYYRITDRDAYSNGARIVGHLDYLFDGGFKSFMKEFHRVNKYNGVTTELFKQSIDEFFSTDTTALFSRFVYGTGMNSKNDYRANKGQAKVQNPIHSKLSDLNLDDMM